MYNNPYNNYNMLPSQQIPQANGKASIDMIRLAPNSSILIADTTAPIVWRCTSDSLGNVTSEPFDITPHKDEAQVQQESLEQRISRLEAIINESTIAKSDNESEFKSNIPSTKGGKKSSSNSKSNATV